MKRIGFVSIALAAILSVVLVGGCAKKADPAPSGPAAGRTLVIFTDTATDVGDFASTTKVGDITQNRNQLITFTRDASDDRLSGTGEDIVNNDARDDGSSTGWGTFKITNDGGTWQGSWSAASGAKLNSPIYFFTKLTGTGDYEGLIGYFQGIFGAETVGFQGPDTVFTGWIEPAK